MKLQSLQQFELTHTAMENSTRSRMAGPGGADGNYHILNQGQYLKSIAFARILEANNPAVKSALNRLVQMVNVGEMTPLPNTGSKDLDEHLQGKWTEDYVNNAQRCCSQGRFSYALQADIAFRRVIGDGDLFPVADKDNPGTVKHLEGHRCQTPSRSKLDRGVCGVKKSGDRVTHFWLTKKSMPYGGGVLVGDTQETPVYTADGWKQATQVFKPDMFSIDRGYSWLGPCGTTESRRDDLEYATVLKAQIASCVTFIEKQTDADLIRQLIEKNILPAANSDFPDATFEDSRDVDDAGFAYGTADINPGRLLRAKLGYDLDMQTPNIPSDGQLQLNMLLLQYLANSLDLPLMVLLLDASGASFTTFRAIMDVAREAFRKHQGWFGNQYHDFRWRTYLRSEIDRDPMLSAFIRLNPTDRLADSKLFRCKFNGKAWRYYHPVDDVTGDLIAVSRSLKSYDTYAQERYGIPGAQLAENIIRGNVAIYEQVLEAAAQLYEKYQGRVPGLVINEQLIFAHPAMQHMGFNLSLTKSGDDEALAAAAVAKAGAN